MLDKFLEYLAIERHYSAHTLVSYRKDLNDFEDFCNANLQMQDLLLVNKKNIRSFIVYLTQKGLSKRSINRKISALNSFYNYLLEIGEIVSSPMETVKTFKIYPTRQQPMSEEEMETLYTINDDSTLDGIIVEVLYQTGMRRAELCNLLIPDIDFSAHQIKITGKGNKQRIVPMGDNLEKKLWEYFKNRRIADNNYFFVTENGKKMSENFVYSKVKSYLGTVTMKEKRSPHILRHSFATHLLNNGAEISTLKNLLGHSSLASTQVYTNANIEKLKSVLNKAHPRGEKE